MKTPDNLPTQPQELKNSNVVSLKVFTANTKPSDLSLSPVQIPPPPTPFASDPAPCPTLHRSYSSQLSSTDIQDLIAYRLTKHKGGVLYTAPSTRSTPARSHSLPATSGYEPDFAELGEIYQNQIRAYSKSYDPKGRLKRSVSHHPRIAIDRKARERYFGEKMLLVDLVEEIAGGLARMKEDMAAFGNKARSRSDFRSKVSKRVLVTPEKLAEKIAQSFRPSRHLLKSEKSSAALRRFDSRLVKRMVQEKVLYCNSITEGVFPSGPEAEAVESMAPLLEEIKKKKGSFWRSSYSTPQRWKELSYALEKEFYQRRISKMKRDQAVGLQALVNSKQILREIQIAADNSQGSRRFRLFSKKTNSFIREDIKRKKRYENFESEKEKKKLDNLVTQTEIFSSLVSSKLGLVKMEPLERSGLTEEEMKKTRMAADKYVEEKKKKMSSRSKKRDAARVDSANDVAVEPSCGDRSEEVWGEGLDEYEEPGIFKAKLKNYQKKGVKWLISLYEQNLNGILADEMGLGKTVQTIALLAHICERFDRWGPFLIVAPSSVVHQWSLELGRFLPELKTHLYWGNSSHRSAIRKLWLKNEPVARSGQRSRSLHIVVTSYCLLIQDYRFFSQRDWEFLVLDEAQAVKNSTTQRWSKILGVQAEHKLLLTGTPIQNTMAELWALLHLIMPGLFDSHTEFGKWFSKDIEDHAQGVSQSLDEHQLKRLHSVLKPFMLRRLKKDVENDLAPKEEIMVECELTGRQKRYYNKIKQLFFDSERLGKKRILKEHVLNVAMQLRKICNHPKLFAYTHGNLPVMLNDSTPLANKDEHYLHHHILGGKRYKNFKSVHDIFRISRENKDYINRTFYKFPGSGSEKSALLINVARNKLINNQVQLRRNFDSESRVNEFNYVSAQHLGKTMKAHLIFSPAWDPTYAKLLDSRLGQTLSSLPKSICLPEESTAQLLNDSGKLQKLDSILFSLDWANDRVLIFSQMTKMINLLESFLKFRKIKFLRFDGTTDVKQRQEMVKQFQSGTDHFVFLLSTRAGGLGINLTAANVVIFYDNDWNPTMDAQAMDRVHRIGQKKKVTIFRLYCKGTIEERILKKAAEKHRIQSTVYSGEFEFSDKQDTGLFKTKELKEMILDA